MPVTLNYTRTHDYTIGLGKASFSESRLVAFGPEELCVLHS
jgi:hypothetical protein